MNDTGRLVLPPSQLDAGSCYSLAWERLKSRFPELLAVLLLAMLIAIPLGLLGDDGDWHHGPVSSLAAVFALAYAVLVEWPVDFGVEWVFLRAARGDAFQISDMFAGFLLDVVIAQLLSGLFIAVGIVFLIVPGIYIACKLAFVPYLVIDEGLDALTAMRVSWRMTDGHAFTVFLIGFMAIFVALAGLIVLIIGIIPAVIWIKLAIANLYAGVRADTEALPV